MVSQLTVYALILCLLMTLFSAGAATRNDIFLQSACNLKFVRVKNGAVFADDNYQNGPPQIFTLEAVPPTEPCFPLCGAATTIYSKETKKYICLDTNGRPKARRVKANGMPKRCLFYEHMDGGAFRFQSVAFPDWYLGFHKNGKPIAAGTPGGQAKVVAIGGGRGGGRERRRQINEKCFNFERSNATSLLMDVTKAQPLPPTAAPPPPPPPPSQRKEAGHQRHQQKQKTLRHQRQQQLVVGSAPDGGGGVLLNGNSLITEAGYTVNGHYGNPSPPPPPHPHRHKHGGGGALRKGPKASRQSSPPPPPPPPEQQHPNLDTAASSPSTTYDVGGVGGSLSGKGGGGRRRNHPNLHFTDHPLLGDFLGAAGGGAPPTVFTRPPPLKSSQSVHFRRGAGAEYPPPIVPPAATSHELLVGHNGNGSGKKKASSSSSSSSNSGAAAAGSRHVSKFKGEKKMLG